MQTLYQILGVPENATPADIKSAFRRLSMQHHPDKNPGNPAAELRFREILEAYKILSDPYERNAYDDSLRNEHPYHSTTKNNDTHDRKSWQAYYEAPSAKEKPLISMIPSIVWVVIVFAAVRLISDGSAELNRAQSLPAESSKKEGLSLTAHFTDNLVPKNIRLADGATISFGNWLKKNELENYQLNFSRRHIPGAPKNMLHISSGDALPGHSKKNWLFIDDTLTGLRQAFAYRGGVELKPDYLLLQFGQDVETFSSCRSCNLSGLPHPSTAGIYLKFDKGTFMPYTSGYLEVGNHVRENLSDLAGRFREVHALLADDGTRKEYLRQLLTWHFQYLDLQSTREIFDHYYRFPDKPAMWDSISAYIQRYDSMLSVDMGFHKPVHQSTQ